MNSIIVVEGYHDASRIKEIYKDANIIITDGSKIKKETIDNLKELSKSNKIIVFTDPDYPGIRIRHIIEENISCVYHAFLDKDKCISKNKKKVGVEHANIEDIKSALNMVYETEKRGNLTLNDLYELGLVASTNSSYLRNEISKHYNIGTNNAKTFLNRINSFNISKEELGKITCKIKEEGLKI